MRCSRLLVLTLATFALFTSKNLHAIDIAKNTPKSVTLSDISHIPPSILPEPGAALELVLNIKNSKVSDLPARLILNSDGRLLETNLLQARFNNQETPEYRFSISAPLAEIQYQFVIIRKDGAPINTQFYTVRRKCIPQINSDFSSLHNPTTNETETADERLSTLVGQARSLEYQIDSYERANKLLDEVKKLLGSQ